MRLWSNSAVSDETVTRRLQVAREEFAEVDTVVATYSMSEGCEEAAQGDSYYQKMAQWVCKRKIFDPEEVWVERASSGGCPSEAHSYLYSITAWIGRFLTQHMAEVRTKFKQYTSG